MSDIIVPVYVINLKKRVDRKIHIMNQFKKRPEFDVFSIEACEHRIGAVGLWNSITKIVTIAADAEEDFVVICEDDHVFSKHYSGKAFVRHIIEAHFLGANILIGGIGGFNAAVPVSEDKIWVDSFWCTQFIIIYKELYNRIIEYNFKDDDTADGVLSAMTSLKLVLFPFISYQTNFGYSDVTQTNNINSSLILERFERTEEMLAKLYQIKYFYRS